MKKAQAVIFDLDGTIVDTEGQAADVIENTLAEWGIALDPAMRGLVSGRTWEVGFDLMFEKFAIPVKRAEAEHIMLERYREAIAKELKVIPGVIDAIRSIASEFPLGLVSGSHRREILFALDQIGVRSLFQVIYGAEDYLRSKPAPDGYLQAIASLGIEPKRGLVFEDSAAGIAAGRAAGLNVVAVTYSNPFGESLAAADSQIPDFRGVDAAWGGRTLPELSRRRPGAS